MKKRSKKFYAWKSKWIRKKRFNQKKTSRWQKIDNYYDKWCDKHFLKRQRRHDNKMIAKKILMGDYDAEYTYHRRRDVTNKWEYLWN